jgi:hypothetical protein
MFDFIKSIVWLAGLAVVGYFVLHFTGHEVDLDYFKESKAVCEERLKKCVEKAATGEIKKEDCDFKCVDTDLIIKKKK